jgi:uncharacterized OB-fold protein
MTSGEPTTPEIPVSQEVRPYFEAAAEGRLLVKRCTDCGQHHHYPRAMCPHCGSERTEWMQASGRGSIYSFAVAGRAGAAAHVLAYVTLQDCGVTMLTSIVTDAPSELRIGAPVQAVFQPGTEGIVVPMFKPLTDTA